MNHKYLSKNYTAALAETGYDTDGTEWHTYRVFDNKGGMIGYAEIMPTGITGLDESIIADLMGVPDGSTVELLTGSSDSSSEHVARIIGTMGEQPTCKTLSDGSKAWYVDGKLHRTDGPAVETPDGYKAWRLNGLLHRTDGPAIEYADGYKAWHLNGLLHRTDGPAIERADGTKEWYLNGECLTEAEHAKRTA